MPSYNKRQEAIVAKRIRQAYIEFKQGRYDASEFGRALQTIMEQTADRIGMTPNEFKVLGKKEIRRAQGTQIPQAQPSIPAVVVTFDVQSMQSLLMVDHKRRTLRSSEGQAIRAWAQAQSSDDAIQLEAFDYLSRVNSGVGHSDARTVHFAMELAQHGSTPAIWKSAGLSDMSLQSSLWSDQVLAQIPAKNIMALMAFDGEKLGGGARRTAAFIKSWVMANDHNMPKPESGMERVHALALEYVTKRISARTGREGLLMVMRFLQSGQKQDLDMRQISPKSFFAKNVKQLAKKDLGARDALKEAHGPHFKGNKQPPNRDQGRNAMVSFRTALSSNNKA